MSEFDPSLLKGVFVVVAENKGGCGKTLMAQICSEALASAMMMLPGDMRAGMQHPVQLIDADPGNQSLASVVHNTPVINLEAPESMGQIILAIDQLKAGACGAVVMDTAGGDEGHLRKKLPKILAALKEAGLRMIVVRPVTLSSRVQAAAANFADTYGHQVGVILAVNTGQGRQIEYFEKAGWFESQERALSLKKAEEVVIEDAGVRWADEASGFGLTIADVALRRVEKLPPPEQAEADKVFTSDIRRWLQQWLSDQASAMTYAMARRVKAMQLADQVRARATPPHPEMVPQAAEP